MYHIVHSTRDNDYTILCQTKNGTAKYKPEFGWSNSLIEVLQQVPFSNDDPTLENANADWLKSSIYSSKIFPTIQLIETHPEFFI